MEDVMSKPNPFIGFRPDDKSLILIKAERERLTEIANGTPVSRAMAVRSLICKTSTMVEKAE